MIKLQSVNKHRSSLKNVNGEKIDSDIAASKYAAQNALNTKGI